MQLSTRRSAVLTGSLLLGLVLATQAPNVGAADEVVAFPETPTGAWEGLLDFSGYLTIDSVSPDGAFTVRISDVIGSTAITVDLTVDDAGEVTGTMAVDLTWFDESVGAAPNGDPFHVLTDHHQTGTLVVSGTAARLTAKGTLDHATNTVASGSLVEEVSGSQPEDVEWVFAVVAVDCYLVGADLVETSGVSLLDGALLPQRSIDAGSGSEYFNALVAGLVIHPKSQVPPPASVQQALDEVVDLSDELRGREAPDPIHLTLLVDAWTALQAELAALDRCQATQAIWLPDVDRSWLVSTLRGALETALERPDSYEVGELIELYDIGFREHALDADLKIAFSDAFHDKLDDAIAEGDVATIEALAAFAAANRGSPLLQEDAEAAL
jgi:hypothetical protein